MKAESEKILEVRDATFLDMITYPDFVVEKGEILFITGPSGSGKSTLLKLLNGTASPSAGIVLYKGEEIDVMDTVSLRRKVLLVSQSIFLFDETIEENFASFYRYREEKKPDEAKMRKYLSLCSADFPLDSQCKSMSGGERQRIFLAICISLEPETLLLDEPTSALDDKTGNILFENLTKYCRENDKTLVVISHNKELAQDFGDRVIDLGEK